MTLTPQERAAVETRWFFYVYQGAPSRGMSGMYGARVASGSCPTRESAEREGGHYLAQYLQDGPHFLVVRKSPTSKRKDPQ